MNGLKVIINALLSKMNGCAKKSEVYKKSETYNKGVIDNKITKLDKSLSEVAKSGNYYDLNNIPDVSDVLRYSSQTLTDAQKTRARTNIGAITVSDIPEVPEQVQVDLYEFDDSKPSYIKNNILSLDVGDNTFVSVSDGGSFTYDGVTFKHVGNCHATNVENLLIKIKVDCGEAGTASNTYSITNAFDYDTFVSFGAVYMTDTYQVSTLAASGSKTEIIDFRIGVATTKKVVLSCNDSRVSISEVRAIKGYAVKESYLPSTIPTIPTANVGDTIKVKAVDENGVPTEWEAVAAESGGGDLYFVNMSYNDDGTIMLDKTLNEISEAYSCGQVVLMIFDGCLLRVIKDHGEYGFTVNGWWHSSSGSQNRFACISVEPLENGTWQLIEEEPIIYDLTLSDIKIYGDDNRIYNIKVSDGTLVAEWLTEE